MRSLWRPDGCPHVHNRFSPVDGAIYALLGLTAAVIRIEQSRPAAVAVTPDPVASERVGRYA